jgi:tRNA modification GTPase
MDGALGRLYGDWAERLKKRLAFIEAEIDFADEELPLEITAQRLDDVKNLEKEIAAHLDDGHRGERLREGFMVALLGAPNAGKSSLLNALSRREAAIVSETPGTTRDAIEVHLDLGGYPVTLVDTAGLRESADAIEGEGVRRALARAEEADIKLLVFDGQNWPQKDAETAALEDEASLIVVNKRDLLSPQSIGDISAVGGTPVSAKTGEGLEAFMARLIEEIDYRFIGSSAPALTRARHRAALEETLSHLRRALVVKETELCAEDLRLAMRALGRITGRVDVEDLLDMIFSECCIGK